MAGERVEKAGRIADQHQRRLRPVRARCAPAARRPRARRCAARRQTSGARARAPPPSRRRPHRRSPTTSPSAVFGTTTITLVGIMTQRVEREISAGPDVHLDEAAEVAEAGVVPADRKPRRAPTAARQARAPRDERTASVGADRPARAHFVRRAVVVAHPYAVDAPAIAQHVFDPSVHDRHAGVDGGAQQDRIERLARARQRAVRERQLDGGRARRHEPHAAQRRTRARARRPARRCGRAPRRRRS